MNLFIVIHYETIVLFGIFYKYFKLIYFNGFKFTFISIYYLLFLVQLKKKKKPFLFE